MEFKLDEVETETLDQCKGLVFRGYSNTFYSNGRIERKEGIKLLKRMSCSGCSCCGWILDYINESIDCDCIIFPDIQDGQLYSIRMINMSRDWETGYIDDFDLEIYQLEN